MADSSLYQQSSFHSDDEDRVTFGEALYDERRNDFWDDTSADWVQPTTKYSLPSRPKRSEPFVKRQANTTEVSIYDIFPSR